MKTLMYILLITIAWEYYKDLFKFIKGNSNRIPKYYERNDWYD